MYNARLSHGRIPKLLMHRHEQGLGGFSTCHTVVQRVCAVMVQTERSTFTNKRNQKISTVSYLPEGNCRPKAVTFFHHGYGEHIGRYERGKCSPQYQDSCVGE